MEEINIEDASLGNWEIKTELWKYEGDKLQNFSKKLKKE